GSVTDITVKSKYTKTGTSKKFVIKENITKRVLANGCQISCKVSFNPVPNIVATTNNRNAILSNMGKRREVI
ncbi:hypothetical protein, partial [Cylindrospermopsis raciborskii]|uniref:hypothetical protein n=1 Tax=Cylindrospermopsis raciborskii TaxID=77022 RepID=UPI0026EC44E7